MSAELKSKCTQRGKLATNVRIEVPSATCLPSCARCSEPSSMTTMPPRIGNHTMTLSTGQVIASPVHAVDEPADEQREAHDHREGIVVQVAGREPAREHGDRDDRFRAAVHEGA